MPLFGGDTSIVGIIRFVIGPHLVAFVVLPSTSFKLIFPPSLVGVVTSSNELMRVLVVAGGNMCSYILGRALLWSLSPMH